MANAEIAQDVARRVAQRMVELEVSINGLAEASGIPYSTLRRKVKGVTEFTFSELLLIAEALGVSPAQFMPAVFTSAEVA